MIKIFLISIELNLNKRSLLFFIKRISVYTIQESINIGVRNWGTFVEDAANIPDAINASDSENSTMEE